MVLNWNVANDWEARANVKKTEKEPRWAWDCNFKLDYDGGLVSVESRFYPPHYQSLGDFWDGSVRIKVLEECVLERKFKCDTLEQLQSEVEDFMNHYKQVVKAKFK